MKRVISLLLCLVLLFGLGDWSALVSAEGTEETVTETQETQEETQEKQSTEEETSGEDTSEEAPADNGTPTVQNEETQGTDAQEEETSTAAAGKCTYLSDIPVYKMETCSVGWGSYMRDQDVEGRSISLLIDGKVTEFTKGVAAHASACLIYDLGENHGYDKFKAYIGIDSDKGANGNGVYFKFYGSTDNLTWTSIYAPATVFKGNVNAEFVDLFVKEYRYFRVDVDCIGKDDSYDHSVMADARFISNDYVASTDPVKVDILDNWSVNLTGITEENLFTTGNAELHLLQYTLVQNCGREKLKEFLTKENTEERVAAFTWLFTNLDVLREYMNGGIPDGSNYIGALEALTDLYTAYKDDLNDTTALWAGETAGMTRGGLYRRMMLCMALVCANGHKGWMARAEISDPVDRYAYFKYNYTQNLMRNEIFENLGVDEMRWVLGNNISDAEIIWLNDYAREHPRNGDTSFPILYSPHHHIKYQWYNYDKDIFYSEENRATYTTKYSLSGYEKYGLVYGLNSLGEQTSQRLWQVFEDGAVCGNISRTGANLAASFGVPACEVGQPGHAAFCIMNKGSNNQMIWGIDNDISGWAQSSNSRRMPADWGLISDSTTAYPRACYVLLSQAALNDLPNYEKAEETLMLLSLTSDNTEKEKICRKALTYMAFHRDAWLELIQLKVKDTATTASELASLAKELSDSPMKFYPVAFRDLMQLIFNRMNELVETDTTGDAQIQLAKAQMLYQNALVRATQATEADTVQPGPCKTLANSLLSAGTAELATFSFDGDNAGKLVFREGFTSVSFKLSLDGGTTWVQHYEVSGSESQRVTYTLTKEEYASLSADKDIYIWLVGWSGEPNTGGAFKIDILASLTEAEVKKLVEVNDYEDRLLGTLTSLEYSTDDGATWRDLTEDTDLSGALTVKVHKKASGTTLQSADATFTFTDNHTDTARSYIRLSRLSVDSFSTEAASKNQQAVKAIDGLESTIWHTQWGGGDNERYITLKTDKPTFFSGIDYLPRTDAGNGTITYCEVLVSVDGENWYTAATASWSRNSSAKSITFTDVAYGQYIRIVGKTASGNFCSAREIRVFENKNFEGKTVAGARLTQEPTKLAYAAGEAISFEGAEVQCVYTDGSTHKVPLSMLTVSPAYAAGEGTQEVSLQYLNLPAMTFEIYVTPNSHTASKLSIDVPAAKTSYILDSAPDISGLVLLATEESTGTVWQVNAEEYQVSPKTFTETGTQTVTLTYQGLTAEYEVTVIGKPQSIAVTIAPAKTTYEIGEALEIEDMVVTVTYEDGSTEDLTYSSGRLRVNGEGFSALPGEKTLTVTLTDAANLTAQLPITVLANLIDGEFRYDVEPSSETPPKYTCYLSGYTNTSNTVVSVPASVTCNGITYQVIGVRTGAFTTAAQVEVLSLPGTIQTLEEDSLSALTGLEQLYLTGISDISNLTIQDGALPEQDKDNAGTIYMAGNDMEEALTAKLTEYQSTGDGEFHMKQDNLVSGVAVESITVTPPAKTVYELEEDYDSTGFTVTAHLTNGIKLPLESTLYTMDTVSTSVYGEHIIQVTYTGDETKTGSFTIEVLKTAPTMLANPEDGVYLTGQTISPLSVTVKDGETGTLRYQWYRSSTETLKPGSDTAISGATGSSYTPSDTGYYYVAVWRLDANGAESNPVYSMAAHIQVRDFAIRVEDASGKVTYYAELDEAMAKASSGSTVYLRQDITVTRQTSVVSKTLTVTTDPELSTPVTIRRDSSYTGCVLEANDCALTLKNIVLDGGAVWTGTTDTGLGRDTENTGVGETASLLRMQNNTQLTLDTATVQNCAVVSGGGAWGAALYVTSGADVTITGSTFKDNALGSGGCGTVQVDSGNSVITVSGSTFTGNYAPVNGGAFCISAGKLDFQSGTIRLCKAGTGGGGIFLDKNGTLDFHGTVDTCAAPNGGGLYLQNTTTLADGVIQNCSATGDGGGIYVSGASFTFADGTIQNCTAANNGGAICVITGSVTMNGGLIDGCTATTGGGGGIATVSTDNATGSVTVNGGTIQNCSAKYAGGCVYSSASGVLTINGGTFQKSKATNYGGAVATNSSSTVYTYINGGTYFENTAGYGGAIFIGGASTAYVKGGTFRENKATATNGGNIYCAWNGGTHNLSGGLFLYDSGWIYKKSSPTVKITGGTYSTELKSTDGVDTANYEVKTTQLQLRGSSDPITAYTVVKKATEAAADHTELKNATILHSEKASASISVLQNSLQAEATKAGITLQDTDITDATTTMALEVTEACTEVNTMGAITRRTFDVTPKATVTYTTTGDSPVTHTLTTTVPNDAIHEKVSFQLPVPGTVTATKAMVYHGEDLLGIYPVETGTDSKYITVSSQSFSQFSYILLPETTCGDLQIKGACASVSDNITMHYRVLVPEGYENPYMVFSIYSDVKKGYVESVVTDYTSKTSNESGTTVTYQVFAFEGINPQRMQDTINATLYASKDGVWYKVDENEYSLKAYLETILSRTDCSAYHSLVSNLIGYGTAAQQYNNYELDNLISDTFKDNENYNKTKVDYIGDNTDFADVLTLTKVDGGIKFRSAALYLNNEVSVLIKFTLEAGTTIDQVKISAKFVDGTKPQEFTEFTDEGDGVYSFLFRNIPATCFSKHILFNSYIGETANDTLEYNVNSYLKAYHAKDTKLGVLAKALFNYGCAAKEFQAANPQQQEG